MACHSRRTCGTDKSVLSNVVSSLTKMKTPSRKLEIADVMQSPRTLPISDESILSNGVSHVSKANTTSSKRQKAAVMQSTVTMENSFKRSQKNKQSRAKNKSKKMLKVLLSIPLPPRSDVIYNTHCQDAVVFVDGGTQVNPTIQPILPPSKNKTNRRVHILTIRSGSN